MVLFAAATKTFKFQEKQIGKRAKNMLKKLRFACGQQSYGHLSICTYYLYTNSFSFKSRSHFGTNGKPYCTT